MTNMVRWDPFSELRQSMDQLFEQGFSRPWRLIQNPNPEYRASFPVDIWDTEDAIQVKAALPGFRPDDVDITVINDVLTIKAEGRQETDDGQRTHHLREITYGSMNRSFSLPVSVDADKAQARYEHGMLYLTLPKAESVRPKQIKVSSSTGNGHLLS